MHAFTGCNTITFESLDLGSSFLHIPYISREYGSSLHNECHRVQVLYLWVVMH